MATTNRVKTWISGDTLTASDLNAEFNNLLTGGINSITNANIASNAAIATSKITFGGSNGQYVKSDGAGGLSYSTISINRAFGFYIAGVPSVANDLSWNPIAPEAMTSTKIWAYCKTAPTGSSMIIRVFNVTQGAAVGSVTIAQSATAGNTTSFTTAAINAGDVLRIDVTTADSNTVGANISVVLETTQP